MISRKIQAILDAQKNSGRLASVVYQPPARANVDLSSAAAPMAVFFVTTEGSIDIAGQAMRESARVQVAFVTRAADMSVDGVTNDVILEGLRPIVSDFIARLRQERTLAMPDTITYRVLYQYDDTNTTGYLLDFTAAEKQGDCIAYTL